jgi:peptidylprolyl isomerase
VFDSSREREPIEFEIGQQRVIPGFEQAVVGMTPGDTKETTIPSTEAYGPHREEMIVKLPKEQFPEGMSPTIGQQLQMQQADGRQFVVTVKEIAEEEVTVDANHPLAGKDLTFELELVEIA